MAESSVAAAFDEQQNDLSHYGPNLSLDLISKLEPMDELESVDDRLMSLLREDELHGVDLRRQLDLLMFYHFDHDIMGDDDAPEPVEQFSFQTGPLLEADCQVCMCTVNMPTRGCCNKMICHDCMMQYLTQKIQDGNVYVGCPASDCSQPVSREEIISRIKNEALLEKYHRFVVNANADPNKKTCPHCCAVTAMDIKSSSKYGHKIVCEKCTFSWCFECHSPSHEGLKCKENTKGLKALAAWTKATANGQRNARKCPKCKLVIQRSGGCDHMRCTQCKTHFCYACGGRQLRARILFGNHYDRLSVLGCPRNFMGGRRKHLRRFVRGSIFSGKLLVGVVASAVLLGLLPAAIVAAVFAGPAIGFIRLHKYLQFKKVVRRARHMSQRSAETAFGYRRPPTLVPRRDLSDGDLDLDELMQRILGIDSPETAAAIFASPESSSLSGSNSLSSSMHSVMSPKEELYVAEKDETTSL